MIRAIASPLLTASVLLALVLTGACSSTKEFDPKKDLTSEQKAKLVVLYTETAQQYLRMGELDRAEGQTLKALELDPANVKCKMIRGWTLQKRGRTEDILTAERIFREILDCGDYRATLGLAECLERKGLAFEEASQDIGSGKRVSEAPDPAARSEQLLRERDRAWKESMERYSKTLSEHPDDVDGLNGAMRMSALLGNPQESTRYGDKLLAGIGPTREFWKKQMLRPQITVEDERLYREKIDHLRDLELATHVHCSSILHKLGRDETALQHLDTALALDPERPELYSRRAELEQSLGHPDKAIADLDQYLHRSTQTYDHPDVKRAYRLRKECEDALRARDLGAQADAR